MLDKTAVTSRLSALLIAGLLASQPGASATGDRIPYAPLFADQAALEIELHFGFGQICKNSRSGKCPDWPATIYYADESGRRHRLDVELRIRGRWKRDTVKCALPALFVLFQEEQTQGTVFQGQTTLPLTTHCNHYKQKYQRYLLSEFLAYRLYNLVSDFSLGVRLTHIAYHDDNSNRTLTRYGFFSEHFRDLAARTETHFLDVDELALDDTDATQVAMLSVFQFMIGNLDWSMIGLHNIAPFALADGTAVPVPFDFDYSGLVNAEYAKPPRFLRLPSVRVRKYRGFCQADTDWDAVFSHFAQIRQAAMKLADSPPDLNPKLRRLNRQYLESFYAIIASDQKRAKKIVRACRDPTGLPQR